MPWKSLRYKSNKKYLLRGYPNSKTRGRIPSTPTSIRLSLKHA